MTVKWKTLFTQLLIWMAAEAVLTVVGLDDLADYGEFVFDHAVHLKAQACDTITAVVPLTTSTIAHIDFV